MPFDHLRRRDFITLLGGAAVTGPLTARAQQPATPVVELLIRIQRLQAEAAAAMIGQFVKEIESQVGWTTAQLPWSAGTIEQRRRDGARLLRQVPAITELAQLDSSGKEQLKVSRLALDVVSSQTDYSQDPKFTEAVAHKVYYGPPYLWRDDLYMTLSLAGTRRDAGVSVTMVALKLVYDVVSRIDVGGGQAYRIDGQGSQFAHTDIGRGQQLHEIMGKDMTRLAQVQAARAAVAGATAERVEIARDIRGREVLTAYAPVPVPSLGWLVFVERPTEEAYAPFNGK